MTVDDVKRELREEIKRRLSEMTTEEVKKWTELMELIIVFQRVLGPESVENVLAAADGLNKLEKNGVSVTFAFWK